MGLLYHILRSLQDREEQDTEIKEGLMEQDGMEVPESLIKLLSRPIGKKLPDDKIES